MKFRKVLLKILLGILGVVVSILLLPSALLITAIGALIEIPSAFISAVDDK